MSYLILIFILLFFPALMGLAFAGDKSGFEGLLKSWIWGTVCSLGLFELVYIPCYFAGVSYHLFVVLYCAAYLLVLAAELFLLKSRLAGMLKGFLVKRRPSGLLLAAFLLLLLLAGVPAFLTHADDDDAFYIASATTAQETDSLYRYDAYTGRELRRVQSRYILSPFPIYIAQLSTLSGMPAAKLAHRCLPLFFVPLSLSVWYLYGGVFYKEDERKRELFFLLAVLLALFSGYSIRNGSVFLLYRIWQGKAVLAAFLLPLVWLAFLLQYPKSGEGAGKEGTKAIKGKARHVKKEEWLQVAMLAALSLAGGMVSSMGIFLVPMLTGLLALVNAFFKRCARAFLLPVASMCPSVVLGLIYLFVLQ